MRTYINKKITIKDEILDKITCDICGKEINKFLEDIKAYVNGKGNSILDDKIPSAGSIEFKPYIAKVNTDELNARKGPGIEHDIECVLNKGVAITIIQEKKSKDGGIWVKGKANYWVNKKYVEFVRYV